NPGYGLRHITGCGYITTAYVTQFNFKQTSSTSGWASFGSLPVQTGGCIDYTDPDTLGGTTGPSKYTAGSYSAYITQNFLKNGSGTSPQTVASTTFVVGTNGLTQ